MGTTAGAEAGAPGAGVGSHGQRHTTSISTVEAALVEHLASQPQGASHIGPVTFGSVGWTHNPTSFPN